MVTVDHVWKRYGDKVAVRDLSFSIHPGELFAFLGRNGAGKTTTIKMMCGLLFPTEGAITIGGFNVQTHGEQARQLISYVPDQPFLYEKLTGREFLTFIANLYGMKSDFIADRLQTVIRQFELTEFVDDITERYSHGMRQRTVFAAAFIHQPKLLIADEPTVGLDPRSIRLLKDLLKTETARGTTIFLSTHSLDIAQELADRIAIVEKGQLIGCGTLAELRQQVNSDASLEELFLKLTEEVNDPAPELVT
ncbi:MAG: ABC transporter ATP-binding protein [Zavarzinella sp.]